jgi:hypothetical protein
METLPGCLPAQVGFHRKSLSIVHNGGLDKRVEVKTKLTAQELDEESRKAKDLVEQNYWHIHRAESPLRHYSSSEVHQRLPPAPEANRISTLIYGNPLLSTGFAVNGD